MPIFVVKGPLIYRSLGGLLAPLFVFFLQIWILLANSFDLIIISIFMFKAPRDLFSHFFQYLQIWIQLAMSIQLSIILHYFTYGLYFWSNILSQSNMQPQLSS